MKKIILALLALSSISIYASEQNLVSKIENRKTHAEIRYYRNNNKAIINLYEQGTETTLKVIEIQVSASELQIEGSNNISFPITRATLGASAYAYEWCFSPDPYYQTDGYVSTPAGSGLRVAAIGVLVTTPLCAILPALPSALGITLAPIDGAITLAGKFNPDNIAKRKFDHLMIGESTKISNRAFKKLVGQIVNL